MNQSKQLVDAIVSAIQEKKGEDITIVDLSHIDGAIANYFIICQGNSPTQVEAIAGSVSDLVREQLHEKPSNVNGLGADQWVAIDYSDVMVHIFLPETRRFYDLENLWQDANLTQIANVF